MSLPTNRYYFAAALIALAFCIGCTPDEAAEHTRPYSTGRQQMGARELRYNLDGGGDASTNDDSTLTLVSFERGTLKFNRNRVLLDDQMLAPLPDDSKIVRVHYNEGKLTIAADGNRIYSFVFPPPVETAN